MKGLGLASAGIGAAAATTPVFHDLDDLMSSPQAVMSRAWYVKNREFGDIGIELDWNLIKRRDLKEFDNWNRKYIPQHYPGGPTAFNAHLISNTEKVADKTKELWPDYQASTRDIALGKALFAVGNSSIYASNCEMGGMKVVPTQTPEQLGIPKWEGTPEENLRMIKAAFSVVGLGPSVGVAELTEKNKNFIWEYSPISTFGPSVPSRHIVFDDNISEYYTTSDSIHIPGSHKYVITTHNMACDELMRRPYSGMGGHAERISYSRVAFAKNFVEEFIRALGYHVVYGHALQPATVWGILGGEGEHGRMGQMVLSPEYGALMRTHSIFYTDLPLSFTPPVDAGITKFCETCGMCADMCPVGAIPKVGTGRSWDSFTGQDWANDKQLGGNEVMYNIPGYKGWRSNLFECAFTPCGSACKSSCPFNTIPDGSFMHNIVKTTVSTTPLFNSFFRSMEENMRYGYLDKEPSSWWDNPKEWHIYGTHPNLLEQ
jgi:reductive dehalogenase|uniref:Reductive dehalogenase-like protein KB1rdhA25 n=1 Tax=Dehalococcoides mccartyi TaxID=61435 RepID=A0A0A7NUZ0_9CHLR|nr:reductive dehalogenase-like protein KB1rdhA25 [Dehalococcoides mccartyi]